MSAVIDRWTTEDVYNDSSCARDIGKLFGPVELCGKPSTLVLHESKAGSHDVYPICDSCAGELGLQMVCAKCGRRWSECWCLR